MLARSDGVALETGGRGTPRWAALGRCKPRMGGLRRDGAGETALGAGALQRHRRPPGLRRPLGKPAPPAFRVCEAPENAFAQEGLWALQALPSKQRLF